LGAIWQVSSALNSSIFVAHNQNGSQRCVERRKAVSVEIGLRTRFEERKGTTWFGGQQERLRRVEERYVTYWTPLKDEEGRVKQVVLTIAPKV
jgi:hypothetical protein